MPHKQFLENAPALKLDYLLYESRGQKVPLRTKIERRIVWNLMRHLIDAGFYPSQVWDGETMTETLTPLAAMEVLFNLDDARLYVKKQGSKRRHWIYFVFGNDGPDVINDYGVLSKDFEGFEKAMDNFNAEDYL